ncbi:MAG: universal stress protein, partial [Proteobacteria bacterium]|nr:universal stress protein [Pseudomonadota bacterium]
MAMKSILVPTVHHTGARAALATALVLAQRTGGYIEGFALRFSFNEFLAVDMAGGMPLESFKQESIEEAKQARAQFEAFMAEKGVARAAPGDAAGAAPSYGWLDDAPEGEEFVGSYGRVFDITVFSRPDPDTIGLPGKAIESALFESGRPVLVAAPTPPRDVVSNVLIAWNRSTEQARAVALAMP